MTVTAVGSAAFAAMDQIRSSRRENKADKAFDAVDSDGNGTVSKDELQAAAALMQTQSGKGAAAPTGASVDAVMKAADQDGNGTLSKEEFSAMMSKMDSHMAAKGGAAAAGPPPGGGGPRGAGGAPPSKSASSSSSSASSSTSLSTDPADTNGDGKVSAAEQLAYDRKQMARSYEKTSGVAARTEPKTFMDLVA